MKIGKFFKNILKGATKAAGAALGGLAGGLATHLVTEAVGKIVGKKKKKKIKSQLAQMQDLLQTPEMAELWGAQKRIAETTFGVGSELYRQVPGRLEEMARLRQAYLGMMLPTFTHMAGIPMDVMRQWLPQYTPPDLTQASAVGTPLDRLLKDIFGG